MIEYQKNMNFISWKVCIVFCCFVLAAQTNQAQRFGGNPNRLKFKVLSGEYVDVVYPDSLRQKAVRVHELIKSLAAEDHYRLGEQVRKIPVVLQQLPLVSNAYVGLGPWRSEFYMTPLQNSLTLGSTDWIDNLAVHEYRHVQQYSNFRKGLSKFAYLIAGEQGQTLANAASIPDWFFEGDAVYTETRILNQGRGRLPSFMDPFRSLWLGNKQYAFQKLRSGSLKDIVPNHYELGYLLVAYGYNKFGEDFWRKVTSDAARFQGLFYPMQKAVKRYSGLKYSKFVEHAIDSFKSNSLQIIADTNQSFLSITKPSERLVTDHLFPVWVGGDSVLALRKAYNELPKWTIYYAGKTINLGIKDIGIDDYFSYKRGYIVYTGYSPDIKRGWREYNDIYLFNIYDRTKQRITKGKRLFSPDLSHNGEKIIAVRVGNGGNAELVLVHINQKKSEQVLPNPDGYFFSYPVFSNDDKQIFVIARKPDGSSGIMSVDLSTGNQRILLPFKNAPIAFLRQKNGKLIFSVSQGRTNQIWTCDAESGTQGQLVSGYTGLYTGDVHESDERLVFSSPRASGEQLFTTVPKAIRPGQSLADIHPLPQNDAHFSTLNTGMQQRFKSGLLNLHSWRPFYEQPEWSFTVYGENILNTLRSSFDYVYNENEGSHKVGGQLIYGALYPWISGGSSYTVNRTFSDSTRNLQWNEWNGNFGLQLPLNFTGGKLFKNLDVQVRFHGLNVDYKSKNNVTPADRYVGYLSQQLLWSMQTQKAVQHIFPRFAYVVRIQNRVALGKVEAKQFGLSSQLFVPGLFKNHAVMIAAGYQSRDTLGQYNYSNNFAAARGYQAFNYPRMWRYSFNYHMPLLYPDLGIANIVYFMRVRTNIFYDDMSLKSLRLKRVFNLRSVGSEIYFDTKWWNQQAVSFGFRYSRLLDTGIFQVKPNPNRFEFIMPLNLLPD